LETSIEGVFMRQGVFNPKLKLLWHCDRVHKWRTGDNIAPVMVEMDLTNRCQLKCNFCTFKYLNDKSDIDTQVAKSAIMEMSNLGVKSINFTGGGEPTLHKDFEEIIKCASGYGIDIGLFTNGYSLTDSMIDTILNHCHWVRISVDASNKKSFFETKRVVGFNKTYENIMRLHKRKAYLGSPTDIGVGFVITKENYKDIPDFVNLWRIFQDIKYIQFKPVIDNCFENNHIEKEWWKNEVEPLLLKEMEEDDRVVINYYKFNDLVSDIEREYDVCYGHQFCPCVGATGDVWVCTHLRGIEGYSFGNLNDTKFDKIWKSQQRQDVIKRIDLSKCQKYCRNNEINKVLYQLKHPDRGQHENFI
jgi:cyclic pyranopterin phosphate synthase